MNTVGNEEYAGQGFTNEFESKEQSFSRAAEKRAPTGHVEYEKEFQCSGHFCRTLCIDGVFVNRSHILQSQ